MSLYTYSESKTIDEVQFKKTANGSIRAYLHANEAATPEQYADILKTLKNEKIQCIPYSMDGKATLELRGFQRESKLITLLDKNKLTEGKVDITRDEEASWLEKLKKRSLQASGLLYAWGDASFFLYGYKGASRPDMAAGILYGVPTPVLLAYGRNDQSELQIRDFAKLMATEFKQHVDTLPPDCALDTLVSDNKRGLFKNASDFLQRYPSEFMNLCYAGAGACILYAANKHLKGLAKSGVAHEAVHEWFSHLQKTKPAVTMEGAAIAAAKSVKTENLLNAGVGGMTVVSGTFGAFVPEKAADPDVESPKGPEALWEWVRARPLTVAGAGLMMSTMLHAASTAIAWKGPDNKHKKAVLFRISFVVSALLAEFMVAISSKGHGEGVVSDKSVDNSAIAIAAELIVKQPKAMQNALIDYMGRFMGQNNVLALGDEAAIAVLRQEVEALRDNPWANLEKLPVSVNAPVPVTKTKVPAWQAKVAVAADAPHVQASHSA